MTNTRSCSLPAAAVPRSGTPRHGPRSRTCSGSSIRQGCTPRSTRPTPAGWGSDPGRPRSSNRRGRVRAKAFVTPTVPQGQVFLPMHDHTTNALTFPDFDPNSRQPAYKGCAVRIRPEGLDDVLETERPEKPFRIRNLKRRAF